MNYKDIFRSWKPYLVAIVVFIALDVVYFAPQFEGEKLKMHDITQYEGMGRDIVEHQQKYGEDPQWAGRMFGGMPAYLINVKYDSVVLKQLRPVAEFLGFPSSLIFVAMLSFLIMLVLYGVNPWVGIVPSIAYGLSTYFFIIIGAGHVTKMVALAYVPLLLGGVFYTYRRNMWLGAALTAAVGSIEIAANHPQITYYFGFVIAAFVINELVDAVRNKWMPKFAKATSLLILAAVLALGSNLAPLWYVQQHSKQTMRGGSELKQTSAQNKTVTNKGLDIEYATQWSYGKMESFNMLVPNLMGGESMGGFSTDGEVAGSLGKYNARSLATQLPAYWGPQPMTAGPTYLGAAIVFIAVLALFLLAGSSTWWVVVVSLLALLLSWGNNMMWFTELFFNYFPGYNKFRTVAMILVIVQWSVPFLAALALGKVYGGGVDRKRVIEAIKKTLYVVGGVTLFFAVAGGMMFDFSSPADSSMGLPDDVIAAMHAERKALLTTDAWRSLFFIVATAAVLWLFATEKVKRWAMITLLAVLVTADLAWVNLRYLPQSRFERESAVKINPTQADKQILQDKEPGYRVANMAVSTFNDATTSYFHRSIGGYHGAKLQRYQDLIERHLSTMNMSVYNMLNTKYFIVADKDGKPQVSQNPDTNGAAWFIANVKFVDTPDQEIDALTSINTKTTAVVDKRFESQLKTVIEGALAADSTAKIKLDEYRPNYLKYVYDAPSQGVAVFSEIFYDQGWTAYIDGQQAPYFRADYVLRAMVVPAGKHVVEFRFRAPAFQTVSGITLACSLLIILWLVVTVVVYFIRKNGSGK